MSVKFPPGIWNFHKVIQTLNRLCISQYLYSTPAQILRSIACLLPLQVWHSGRTTFFVVHAMWGELLVPLFCISSEVSPHRKKKQLQTPFYKYIYCSLCCQNVFVFLSISFFHFWCDNRLFIAGKYLAVYFIYIVLEQKWILCMPCYIAFLCFVWHFVL